MTSEIDNRMRCPKCGGSDVRRSHSKLLADRIMEIFHKRPFRCRFCECRFYRYCSPNELSTSRTRSWRDKRETV